MSIPISMLAESEFSPLTVSTNDISCLPGIAVFTHIYNGERDVTASQCRSCPTRVDNYSDNKIHNSGVIITPNTYSAVCSIQPLLIQALLIQKSC